MLGVTVGVLIRRTVPAMAVTLAIFAAVQIAMPLLVRPHLLPPVRASSAFNPATLVSLTSGGNGGQLKVTGAVNLPGAWVLDNQTVTPAGHEFGGPALRGVHEARRRSASARRRSAGWGCGNW